MATGTGTSLFMIAVGAVLAFAVSFQVAGINIVTIGMILMVVGIIGLVISVATIAGYAPWGAASALGRQPKAVDPQTVPATPTQASPVAPQASVNASDSTADKVAPVR